MNRVATIPLQRTMSDAIQRSQQSLAITQQRLATGKKAMNFADLGTETVRNLSAHSLLARQDAQSAVAKRVGTTTVIMEANIKGIETSVSGLQKEILAAVGTGDAAGLQDAIDATFRQYRASLNATEGNTALFGGSQTDTAPFTPEKLSDLVGMNPDDAFVDDGVRASARVAENVDVTYGIGASELGKGLFAGFQKLAELSPVGAKLDEAQKAALKDVVAQLGTGLDDVRNVNATNGRNMATVETLEERGADRALVLTDVIARNEDADLGQVALDLAQQMATLQASYSVFGQLSGLSLVDYIR